LPPSSSRRDCALRSSHFGRAGVTFRWMKAFPGCPVWQTPPSRSALKIVWGRDGRRPVGIEHHGVLVGAAGIVYEVELHAVPEFRVRGEPDGVVLSCRMRGDAVSVALAVECTGRCRVAEQEERLPVVLERIAEIGGHQPVSRRRLVDGRLRRTERSIHLAGHLADLPRGAGDIREAAGRRRGLRGGCACSVRRYPA